MQLRASTARTSAVARAGFTLIEILAVILIIGILATILLTQLGEAEDSARIQNTRRQLAMLEGVIDAYTNEKGNCPPSSFTSKQGVQNDGTNVGVEVLVVALWSDGYDAGDLGNLADGLINSDADASGTNLTDFDTRNLLEIADDWGNPIAYFNRRDYGETGRVYVTYDPITGVELRSIPKAFKNATTGRFYRASSYQLISAGPDGLFDTEDDVTTFDHD